jgi:PAS domain S-box-containing protein
MAVAVVSRSQEVVGGLCFGHPEPGRFPREAESHIAALAAQASIAIDNARLYTGLQEQLDQQRQMATALRESEELSSSILNSTADCIKVLDLQGNLLYMNPPGLALFGIEDFEPLRGMPWPLLWPEEMRPKLLAAIGVALEGELGKFEGCCPTKEGAPKWWDVIVSPLKDAMGTVTKLTATSRDITDRHVAAEQALQAAEEIARQNRMKDEFLATLSHELRTPLQSIMGWTQILIGGGFDQAELAQGLEVIDRNAHAQTRIIEDLLDMSRILSGKVRLDVQKVELSHLIEAALDSVRPAAQAKGITLQSILDPLARPVSGDPGRLQQVFWNLLSNAIKFTPRGGKVQVLLERVNSHLEVSIADNGAGIDPEFLPHVFERFKQADASITRRHGGLGLGLAIVKHLVELHGGSVRVKSPGPGLGATFSISFPLAPVQVDSFDKDRRHPDGRESSRAGGDLPRLDGVRILAVDDEPDARNLLAVMLRKAGAEVITCGSAAEALSLIPGLLPQVLISDVGMSPVDGYSLIQAVRKLPEEQGGGLAAIALTAYTRSEDRIKAIASGFQVHLAKPAHAMELLTMVRSLSKASRVSGEN